MRERERERETERDRERETERDRDEHLALCQSVTLVRAYGGTSKGAEYDGKRKRRVCCSINEGIIQK